MRQEIQHHAIELVGVLPLRPMSATVEDMELSVQHAPQQPETGIHRNETVVSPPDDEGRRLHFGKPVTDVGPFISQLSLR